jgi:hypothetical protein
MNYSNTYGNSAMQECQYDYVLFRLVNVTASSCATEQNATYIVYDGGINTLLIQQQ